MADETTNEQVSNTGGEPPAVPPVAAAAQGTPPESAAPAEGEEGHQPASPPQPAKEDFAKLQAQKRIDKLTAKTKALEAQLAAAQAAGKAPSAQDEAALAKLVEEKAAELASQKLAEESFSRKTREVYAEGEAKFGKEAWGKKVEELMKLRDPSDPVEMKQYRDFVSAIIETGEAPRIIASLADDLAEGARLMALPPLKLGMELAKLALKAPPEELTKAPKPITVVGSRGRSHEPLRSEAPEGDRLSTAEWMRRRAERVEQVNKEAGRRLL